MNCLVQTIRFLRLRKFLTCCNASDQKNMELINKETVFEALRKRGCVSPSGELKKEMLQKKVCAIVPAAGKGTRLDYDGPKVLFPYKGKTILHVLYGVLEDIAESFCLVINPKHRTTIQQYLNSTEMDVLLAEQEQPTGMGDAILCARSGFSETEIENCDFVIVWGDQITVSKQTVLTTLLYHQFAAPESVLAFPTCRLDNPYIHFEKDENCEITALYQKREGDTMPETGESDCGVFVVRGTTLFRHLETYKQEAESGAQTREFNFLPFIVWLADNGHKVVALPIAEPVETRGINTKEDVDYIESTIDAESGN